MNATTCCRNSPATAFAGAIPAQTRRSFLTGCAALVVLGSVDSARSEPWPQQPVKLVVPFPPGGLSDGIARLIGEPLAESLKQPFVIENMAGAAGAIAARYAARAPADGHTLFLGSLVQIAILPALGDVTYDPVHDFAPISNVARAPFVLMIHASVPATTLKEFVEYVRAQPGRITYSSSGVGSLEHLSMALFQKRAGIEMIHVPYKGGPQAITDLIAGHVAAYFGSRPVAAAQSHSEKIRLLAISDQQRSAQFPDVPTVAESGYPGFRTVTWNGLMAPARTPSPIIDKLAEAVQRAIKNPASIQNFVNFGVDPIGDTQQEFAATIAADMATWAEAVNVAGLKKQP